MCFTQLVFNKTVFEVTNRRNGKNKIDVGIDFLDVLNEMEFKKWKFPSFKIHTTCFEEFENEEILTIEKVKKRALKIMEFVHDSLEFLHFQFIKNVSKTKSMICVSILVKTGFSENEILKKHDIEEKLVANGNGVKKIKTE